jgi:hypothetical protein
MPFIAHQRPECVADTECYVNYWSLGVKSIADGRTRNFEMYEGHPLDKKGIASIFRKWRVFTFNGRAYDLPMILYAMSGASNAELKRANDELILLDVPYWTFMERHGLKIPDFIDHVDLISVTPGAPQMPSLKLYAGRLHSRKMQELPFEVDSYIGEAERQVLEAYEENDLDVTIDMRNDLKAQVELRTSMSEQYGIDLRSKSDAQIAEAVIKVEIERALCRRVYAPDIEAHRFKYQVPLYIKFNTHQLQEALQYIRGAELRVTHAGKVEAPDRLKKLNITLNGTSYQMGIGGLHSQESKVSHYSDDAFVLKDRDVTSYYPRSILLQAMYPKHLGPVFLKVYESIYNRRIAAKRAGDKNTAETLKIVLNGTYGKLGSPYSIFFSPNLMIQVTLTGQLAILMLIERIEQAGIHVISANTDGIVSKVPRDRIADFNAIFKQWEADTGYETEETEYISLHSQSINSYVALYRDKDGNIRAKRKGPFAESGPGLPGASGQKKNPDMDICKDAVVEFLKHGTPVEETIEWCADPRKFLVVQRVTGGAMKDGTYLGKALRWYYSKEVQGGFERKDSGNSVPQSVGAKLMMTLLPYVPADVDYDYYVREAYAILEELGVPTVDPRLRGRTGRIFARLPDAKNIHIVDARTGVAICGKARDSIRDSWVEYLKVPDGHRLCGKCKKENDL